MKNYTEEEFKKVFQKILHFYQSRYSSQEYPKAVLLGGQPGAGKSGLENMINWKDEYVSISGDDYRKFHPQYDQLNAIYGREASKYTQQWAGEMVEHLIQEAKKEKWNVIIEGTLRTSELPIREAKGFREKGYSVELYVIAVKPEKSYLGTLQRYEEMIKKGRIPRMTPKDHHDLVVEKIAKNLGNIYQEKVFDSIYIYDRENNLLYNQKDTPKINPKDILEQEFHREWKVEEIKEWKERWEYLIQAMKDRRAPVEEIVSLQKERNKTLEQILQNQEKTRSPWSNKIEKSRGIER